MATGESIAKEAFEQLAKSIHVTDQPSFSNATIADVWKTVRDMEKEQAAHRDVRFMRRIERFINTLEEYSEILTILCQGWPLMSFAWGPIRWILLIAKKNYKIMDDILQAYKEIGDTLPRIDLLRRTFPESENLNRTIGWIYSDLLEFHGRAYKMFRRRGWQYWFAFDWGLYQKRFRSVLQRLSRNCDIIDREAAAAHFAEMKIFRDQRKDEDEAFEKRQRFQMFRDVATWLSESEDAQEEYLHQIADVRQNDACRWILEDAVVNRWIEDGHGESALWMTGIPGSGKTFLASMIIDHHIQSRDTGCCAYFFCGHNTSADTTCVKILRTLSAQILRKNSDMAPLIHEAFLQKGLSRSAGTLKNLLVQIIPEIPSVHFVLDGLGELESSVQESTLRSLRDILKESDKNSRLLISSRDEPQIRRFKFQNQNEIQLEGRTTQALGLYIQSSVEKLKSDRKYIDDHLRNNIESRLVEKADGMFLWVRLVLAMLNEKATYAEMEDAISDLPDGLEEAYGRILSRISKMSPYRRRRAFKILSWLCVSRRPVNIHEIIDGIALDFTQRELNNKTRISNPSRDIFDLYAPLLENKPSGRLELVHFSAKEYLISDKSGPFLEAARANFYIAQSCMINLVSALDFVPRHSSLNDTDLETRTVSGTYGLTAYSIEFWSNHLLDYLSESKRLEPCENHETMALLQSLLQLSKRCPEQRFQPGHPNTSLSSLKELDSRPELRQLVESCLHRPQKLKESKAKSDDPKQQEEWFALSDDTYITLISCRLRDTTNRILAMLGSALPSHINSDAYQAFVNRFGWRCKYIGCGQEFKSDIAKASHEESHVISFPCPHCDFFGMGFRSRKDLQRHVQVYHSEPSDLEVPSSLHLYDNGNQPFSKANASQKGQMSCWNERGLRAMQAGLQQILKNVSLTLENRLEEQEGISSTRPQSLTIRTLKQKVEQQQYDSLESFKHDLRQQVIENDGSDQVSTEYEIEIACRIGLRNAVAHFPGFSNVEGNLLIDQVLMNQSSPHASKKNAQIIPNDNTETAYSRFLEGELSNRSVRWSETEIKGFPSLLKKFGSDFLKLAEELGTKTEEDVAIYYAELVEERPDLAKIVREADFKPEHAKQMDLEPSPTVEAIESDQSQPDPTVNWPPIFAPSTETSELSTPGLWTDSRANQGQWQSQGTNPQDDSSQMTQNIKSAKSPKKKRVRPKAYCSHCTNFPDGLFDEYALRKHVERFHVPYRKVWTCSDNSIDKHFFDDCNTCGIGERYLKKNDASKHLRSSHFTPETKQETLDRWMQENMEPNPNFKSNAEENAPALKRQKKEEGIPRIPPLKNVFEGVAMLPPMDMDDQIDCRDNVTKSEDDEPVKKNSSDSGMVTPLSADLDPSSSFQKNSDNNRKTLTPVGSEQSGNLGTRKKSDDQTHADPFLPDVSFDNLIGMGGSRSRYIDINGPLHRCNLSLIKPDQVPKLPHLDQARKLVCSDQVCVLYNRLDQGEPGTTAYNRNMETLEVLSRTLKKDLQDWRQKHHHAPDIPFSPY